MGVLQQEPIKLRKVLASAVSVAAADQGLVSLRPLRGSRICLDRVNLLVIWGWWGKEASVT